MAPDFYLTGGTALSRFYLHHRYSDDLDLFVNRDKEFTGKVNRVLTTFQQQFEKVDVQLSDTDFMRMFIEMENVKLKIEFINDVSAHNFSAKNQNNWLLDSWQNILSNKISALSRNTPKDYVDVLFLSLKYSFNWVELFEAAKQKDAWVNEITVAEALHSFDIQRMTGIRWIDKNVNVQQFQQYFQTIAKDILMAADNSLKPDSRDS